MAASEGQVRVSIELTGKGNAVAHLKQTATGFDLIKSKAEMLGTAGEKLANGLNSSFDKARSGTLKFKDGLDAALDVASAFGPWGKIISGVGKSVVALVDGISDFVDLSPRVSAATVAIVAQQSSVAVLAARYKGLAINAENAAKAIEDVARKRRGIDIDTARASGDDQKAGALSGAESVRLAQADLKEAKGRLNQLEGQVTEARSTLGENERKLSDLNAQAFANKGNPVALAAIDGMRSAIEQTSNDARKIIEATTAQIPEQQNLVQSATAKVRAEGQQLQRLVDVVEDSPATKPAPEPDPAPRGGGRAEVRIAEVDALLARLAQGATAREEKLEAIADDGWRRRLDEYEAAQEEASQKRIAEQASFIEKMDKLNGDLLKTLAAANDNGLADQYRQIGDAALFASPGVESLFSAVSKVTGALEESARARADLATIKESGASPEQKTKAETEARKKNNLAIKQSIAVGGELAASVVKDEKSKQLVYAITQAGLGFASLAMYDYGAAALHFGAAAILGYKAFAGPGGGAGAGGAGGRTPGRRTNALTETSQGSNSPWVFQFNAPFYGNPQAAAVAFWEMAGTADGTGFNQREAS